MTVELLTFADGEPAAFLIFRPWGGPRTDHSYIVELANREELPAFLSIYRPDFSEQLLVPLNGQAEALFSGGFLDRLGWTSLLYHVRGERLPAEILCDLAFAPPLAASTTGTAAISAAGDNNG
jgi:hypothetical protein